MAYLVISRAFDIGAISDAIGVICVLGSCIFFTSNYCYLEGSNLYVVSGFNEKKHITLTFEKIDKIVAFNKILGLPPKFDHQPVDDVVIYSRDGSRWTSAFYFARIDERRSFNKKLIESAQKVNIERVDAIHVSKIN